MTPVSEIKRSNYTDPNYDLIEACRLGDQKSQFLVYKLYYRSMFNVSLRILKDPMESEDVIQEAFLTAFDQISKFSGTVSFGAWLKKIVTNRSIDQLRKRKAVSYEEIEAAYVIKDTGNVASECDCNPEVLKTRITNAISNLTECCRKVFSLYFIEGYDHEEISEILCVSESTSRSMLSRARRKLASELQDLR